MNFEKEFDCNLRFRNWIIDEKLATAEELDAIEKTALENVREARKEAWDNFLNPIKKLRDELEELTSVKTCKCPKSNIMEKEIETLKKIAEPTRKDVIATAKHILRYMCKSCNPNKPVKELLRKWVAQQTEDGLRRYSSHLYSEPTNRTEVAGLNLSFLKILRWFPDVKS